MRSSILLRQDPVLAYCSMTLRFDRGTSCHCQLSDNRGSQRTRPTASGSWHQCWYEPVKAGIIKNIYQHTSTNIKDKERENTTAIDSCMVIIAIIISITIKITYCWGAGCGSGGRVSFGRVALHAIVNRSEIAAASPPVTFTSRVDATNHSSGFATDGDTNGKVAQTCSLRTPNSTVVNFPQ